MSAVAIASPCLCGSIGADPKIVRQCPEHFHIWRGDKRLTSVGRIISATFPLDPSIKPDVLANAQERGSEVDHLFAQWLRGSLDRIPIDTRKDSRALFDKLRSWFDAQHFKTVDAQVLLGGDDHGGVLDLRFDGVPCELKCTYDVLHTHRLQIAAYCDLDDASVGTILHVTQRLKTPEWLRLTLQDFDDWRLTLDHWRMIKRRTNGKGFDEGRED